MAEVVICKTVRDLQKYFESKFTDLASKDDINSLKDIIIKQQSIIEVEENEQCSRCLRL